MQKYLGIDVGGTNVKFSILTAEGQSLQTGSIPTAKTKDEFLNNLVELIKTHQSEVDGVGLSFPGLIDTKTGTLNTAGALNYLEGFELKAYLQTKIDLPLAIENDANCVAHAEKWLGNAKNAEDFICMTVGTGVGGAVYVNNQIVRGHNFAAGEFGFLLPNGPKYTSSNSDTLSLISGIYPLRYHYSQIFNLDIDDVDGVEVFQSRDPRIVKMIDKFFEGLAVSIYTTVYFLNPQKILIGGAISSDSKFRNRLKKEVEALGIIKEISYKIEPCKFLNESGCIGAVKNLLDELKE